jgi:hypothetical protein
LSTYFVAQKDPKSQIEELCFASSLWKRDISRRYKAILGTLLRTKAVV